MVKKIRCKICKRKLKLSDIVINKCQCGINTCAKHNAPWKHECKITTNTVINKRQKELLKNRLTNNKLSKKLVDII